MDANADYTDAITKLKNLSFGKQQQAIAETVSNLPEDEKVETVANAAKNLTSEQQEIVAAGLLVKPTAKINDTIWLIVIGAFASILVGTVAVISIGWFLGKTFEPSFLTIFTSVSAFLIGLFAQSPIK